MERMNGQGLEMLCGKLKILKLSAGIYTIMQEEKMRQTISNLYPFSVLECVNKS
jgi:hypothetical protein